MVVDDQGVIKLYDLPGQKEVDRMAQGSVDLLRQHHIRSTKKYIEGPLSIFNPSWNVSILGNSELKTGGGQKCFTNYVLSLSFRIYWS